MIIKCANLVSLLLAVACPTLAGHQFDSNDFATEWIEYDPGFLDVTDAIDGNSFDNPAMALGRPTIDTTGDILNIPVDTNVPVVSMYPAFRSSELVSIGITGHLVLKFNHRVSDDKNNLYGVDFIVFGNVQQDNGNPEIKWNNSDPAQFSIDSNATNEEFGIVRVSQAGDLNDANDWYEFTNGPFADGYAPTLGRVYDPNDPNTSIGAWNLSWGKPTNPTLPLDPNLGSDDFVGTTVAQMAQIYDQSAGGTGFDLKWLSAEDYNSLQSDPNTGRKWIQYVWIEDTGEYSPEIDAVSDVACCGDYKHPFPDGDADRNCTVDYFDLALVAYFWLADITGPEHPAQVANLYDDNRIDWKDLAVLADTFGQCTWDCP